MRAVLLAVVAGTIGCDQVSKHYATVHLMGAGRHSFLGDALRLEYAENTGAFLGLGAALPRWARTALFSVCTGIMLAACVLAALRRRWPPLRLLGLALVFAGGVSNLVDRVKHGSVVDFLNVGFGALRTGIFNVADMAIMLGLALVLLGAWSRGRAAEPAA